MTKTVRPIIDGTRATQSAIMAPYLATITSKLQLTLPKRLCTHLGLKCGEKMAVSVENGAIILTPMRRRSKGGLWPTGRGYLRNLSIETYPFRTYTQTFLED